MQWEAGVALQASGRLDALWASPVLNQQAFALQHVLLFGAIEALPHVQLAYVYLSWH